jgi:ABC-type branched-subunit amino acid transport system ATPase component
MLERLRGLLGLLHARGTTVVFVEHHMGFVSSLADHVVALVAGRKAAEGTPQEVRSHQELVSAYLGRRRDEPC